MLGLLTNTAFLSLVSVIISAVIAPILTEQIKKSGEKQREQIENITNKHKKQLERVSEKLDEQTRKLDEIDNKLQFQDKAIAGVMRYELVQAMNAAVKRKYTTTKEIADIHDLLEPYHELGGNGTVDIMYSKFKKLPIDDTKGEIL